MKLINSKIKLIIAILILIIANMIFAKDILEIIYDTKFEYRNHSFDKARMYNNQMDSTDRFAVVSFKLKDAEIMLFEREKITEETIESLRKETKRILRIYKEDYIISSLLTIQNDIDFLEIANYYYQNEMKLNHNKKEDLLKLLKKTVDEIIVSTDLLPVLSYILYMEDEEDESVKLLNRLYYNDGFNKPEQDYLYYLHLVMFHYIVGNYTEAKYELNLVLGRELELNYYYYLESISFLYASLLSYKTNDTEGIISNYSKFIEKKKEMDNLREFNVPVMRLLSPMPGVFPPDFVYDDLEAIQKIWEKSK